MSRFVMTYSATNRNTIIQHSKQPADFIHRTLFEADRLQHATVLCTTLSIISASLQQRAFVITISPSYQRLLASQ